MALSPSTAITRPDLGLMMDEYDLEASRQGFIGLRLFRKLDVTEQAGVFGRMPIEELLKMRNTNRAPGSGYARQGARFEEDSYACKENGAEEPVDDREANMYRYRITAEKVAVNRAKDAVLRNHEVRVATKVYDTAVWTGSALTTAVSTQWQTVASATPITDVKNAKKKVFDGSGLMPNALVINWHQAEYLRESAQILDRIKYSGKDDPKAVTTEILAQALDLKYILIAGGQYNSATAPGALALTKIWSNTYAMICRIAETDDVREPCIGRTFHYTGDGSEIDGRVEQYRDEPVRSEVFRVRHDTDEKLLYPQAAHLLTNVAA